MKVKVEKFTSIVKVFLIKLITKKMGMELEGINIFTVKQWRAKCCLLRDTYI